MVLDEPAEWLGMSSSRSEIDTNHWKVHCLNSASLPHTICCDLNRLLSRKKQSSSSKAMNMHIIRYIHKCVC